MLTMTKLFEQAIEAARALPPAMQDDAARLLLHFLGVEAILRTVWNRQKKRPQKCNLRGRFQLAGSPVIAITH
jgi:hypothetical protein